MCDRGDIIWFLDDDDFWEEDHARACIKSLQENDIDAVSVNPYQVVGLDTRDRGWKLKYFTKFFKNVNINYRKPWPHDLIFKGDELLYWRVNKRAPRVPYKFFHLSEVKSHSFRNHELKEYKNQEFYPVPLGVELPKPIHEILISSSNI